jgi:hypothetical protein
MNKALADTTGSVQLLRRARLLDDQDFSDRGLMGGI